MYFPFASLFSAVPLALWVWMVHMLAYHGLALGFEWCDRNGALKRFKRRNIDRLSYGHILRRVLINQIFVLLPAMLLCQYAGLAYVGAPHLSLAMFTGGLVAMSVGHDVVQYAAHRWLLHHPRLRWLGHSLHHATGASKSISALYMSSGDFFLNIVCPYLVPLILIGGGGSDVLFHLLTMGLGVIGGLYEHSGYDFGPQPGIQAAGLMRLLPASITSSHAHGEHHRRFSVSFSDGFGSPGLCDTLFGTRWDRR
jgi:sterol desaturase/sphingolipid hydroxylase (fatty acid hydroxylase superfamily)